MYIERLNILAKHLEYLDAVEPEARSREFDMRYWWLIAGDKARPCRTAACALGEATAIPALQKEGLELVAGRPAYRNSMDMEAAVAFFGLSIHQAWNLFSVDANIGGTPGSIARKIRYLTATQETPA